MESTKGIPLEYTWLPFRDYSGNTSGIHAERVGKTMEMREGLFNGYGRVM